jgi:hypothetical protein
MILMNQYNQNRDNLEIIERSAYKAVILDEYLLLDIIVLYLGFPSTTRQHLLGS